MLGRHEPRLPGGRDTELHIGQRLENRAENAHIRGTRIPLSLGIRAVKSTTG